jgi:hypothetical protein
VNLVSSPGHATDFSGLNNAAWGFTIDTANQAIRMVLSGMFDRFPNLTIIVGNLGEGLPFLLDRLDDALKRPGNRPIAFKQTFCDHFYVTEERHFLDAGVAVFNHANGDRPRAFLGGLAVHRQRVRDGVDGNGALIRGGQAEVIQRECPALVEDVEAAGTTRIFGGEARGSISTNE